VPVPTPAKLIQYARLAAGFRSFLGSPLTLDEAERELRSRLEAREARLVAVLRDLVYGNPSSPYLPTLRAAGCELGDLEASARTHGVDSALAFLAASGVRTSVEELKASGAAFDNPRFLGKALTGATSGTTTPRSRVVLDWNGLAEESANELLLYAAHGLERAPLALYLPPPPGLAGVRNLVIHAKLGRPPEAWFDPGSSVGVADRAQAAALSWSGRIHGVRLPQPLEVGPERVARWLAAAGERRVLSAFTGPALRVVTAAQEAGLDIGGNVVFATGEPLSEARRRQLESAGLQAFSRYVSAESGVIGGACPEARAADDMHVWSDRIAVVEADDGALLFTCLSPHNGKVLINAELGDGAQLERRPCSCLLGRVGLEQRLSQIRSTRRLTAEGASVLASELDEIVGALVERAGGSLADYQLVEERDDDVPARISLLVNPKVVLDEDRLVTETLAALRRRGPGERLAADLWERAGTLHVVRARPRLSGGAKLGPVVSGGSR
jgi:hypothetical protein